jgi:hypothetical protein
MPWAVMSLPRWGEFQRAQFQNLRFGLVDRGFHRERRLHTNRTRTLASRSIRDVKQSEHRVRRVVLFETRDARPDRIGAVGPEDG